MPTRFDYWRMQVHLAGEMTRIAFSSAETINRRLLGPSFMQPGETFRMWAEKPAAFIGASLQMLTAAQRGASPLVATRRGLRGIRQRTEANAKRLRH
jgi:hypothetical protein